MARQVSAGDAKRLLSAYQEYSDKSARLEAIAGQCRAEISAAVSALRSAGAVTLLSSVPVEELNRSRKGIRVKLLRDAGYYTVADIRKASSYQLAAVNGISPEGAEIIRQAAEELAQTAESGAGIRLSADDRNPGATALVSALYKYKQIQPFAERADAFRARYGAAASAAARDMKPAASSLRWLFASSEKRTRAESAYQTLNAILSGADLSALTGAVNAAIRIGYVSEREAWADFSRDSIRYISILEAIEPGAVGSGDTVYGLPEELAENIADVALDLNGLRCTLRRYQEWGVKYAVAQRRILLGDEMGLGKTVQAIAVMVHLRNKGASHFAVVCPASVLTNWCREIAKHSDLDVIRVHGSGKEAAVQEWLRKGGVAVTTYETTAVFDLQDSFRFCMLTVDEAHYIKNPSAQRTGNVKRLCAHADRLLFMTGTALENRVGEMATLIAILNQAVSAEIAPMLSLARRLRPSIIAASARMFSPSFPS